LVSILLTMGAKDGNYTGPALLIFLAAVFDYLDGFAARLVGVYSDLGKQLDSMADLVSFGVAPGVIIFRILSSPDLTGPNFLERMHIVPYIALVIPVCSAFRLAKFNIDPRQEFNFIGLPTPANGIFFASVPLILSLQPYFFVLIKVSFFVQFFSSLRILTILVIFMSYLLVSDLRLFSMKFRNFAVKENVPRYMILILALILLGLFSLNAIPMIIIAYILLSLFFQRQIGR
jgi:CDP-diacylglycerol---serine O-phosphatidyltransferase